MNLALEEFADNPVIDELVQWPPRPGRIISIRGCSTLFRKPFIELLMEDDALIQHHFMREAFAEHWAEAVVIIEAITSIKIVSDFDFRSFPDPDELIERVLASRLQCIAESNLMFDNDMFEQFLDQYGEDCYALPEDAVARVDVARAKMAEARPRS
ncbi:MAG: hypothetical protein ACI87H_001957 [Gammaproteobacteria bacterium]|jgi:hypothetical protein